MPTNPQETTLSEVHLEQTNAHLGAGDSSHGRTPGPSTANEAAPETKRRYVRDDLRPVSGGPALSAARPGRVR